MKLCLNTIRLSRHIFADKMSERSALISLQILSDRKRNQRGARTAPLRTSPAASAVGYTPGRRYARFARYRNPKRQSLFAVFSLSQEYCRISRRKCSSVRDMLRFRRIVIASLICDFQFPVAALAKPYLRLELAVSEILIFYPHRIFIAGNGEFELHAVALEIAVAFAVV